MRLGFYRENFESIESFQAARQESIEPLWMLLGIGNPSWRVGVLEGGGAEDGSIPIDILLREHASEL